jgi:hypothetical protein
MNYPEEYKIMGLPQADGSRIKPDQEYVFAFGHPEYIPDNKHLVLHITEHGNRDAEGRPKFPEQEEWIQDLIKSEGLNLYECWYSHWLIKDDVSYKKIIDALQS